MLRQLLADYQMGRISKLDLEKEMFELTKKKQGYELLESQKVIFAQQMLNPSQGRYNIPICLCFEKGFDSGVFREACFFLLEQYPWLNTVFIQKDNMLLQQYNRNHYLDFSQEIIEDYSKEKIIEILQDKARKPLSLDEGPLIKVYIVKSLESHYVLITIHHIIFDGSSISILLDTLLSVYEELLFGKIPQLIQLDAIFENFVQWEKKLLKDKVSVENTLNYWLDELCEKNEFWNIPFKQSKKPLLLKPKDYKSKRIPSLVGRKVNELCLKNRLNPSVFFLSVFKILLFGYSYQSKITVGIPLTLRPEDKFENIPGFFVNMIPITGDVTEDQSFIEISSEIQKKLIKGLDNAILPYPSLIKELGKHGIKKHGLFNVAFAYQNYSQGKDAQTIEGKYSNRFSFSYVNEIYQESIHDFELEVFEIDSSFEFRFKFKDEKKYSESIERVKEDYLLLINEIVAKPDNRISSLGFLYKEEKEERFQPSNKKSFKVELGKKSIHKIFEDIVDQIPNRTAISFGEIEISYKELDEKSNRLANFLKSYLVEPETLVAVHLERSPESICAFLAVLKCGGVYLPLDTSYPRERLLYMLEDSGCKIIITDSVHNKLPSSVDAEIIFLEENQNWILSESELRPDVNVNLDDLAYVIYTSGSTGKPKGVLVEHKGLPNLLNTQKKVLEIEKSSRVLLMASLSFDASVWEIVMTLCNGAELIIDGGKEILAGKRLLKILGELKITHITVSPSVLATIPEGKLPFLRTIVVAGEACNQYLINRWSGGRIFLNAYGPTEYTVCATISAPLNPNEIPNIGKPILNTGVYVLDEHLNPVPNGISGELYVYGIGIARGYLNKPELTKVKFVDNPFVEDSKEKMYRTGDMVRYNENGVLEFIGRDDSQVKIRGIRIELSEIESCLNGYDLVKNSAVLVRTTNHNKQIIAFFSLKESDKADDESELKSRLKSYLRGLLPEYMIPNLFVRLEKFPLTYNGKIDREQLEKYSFTSPKTINENFKIEIENTLVKLWKETLELNDIDTQKGFLEVGGDSITAVLIADKIAEYFKVIFTVTDLFKYGSINDIAKYLRSDIDLDHKIKKDKKTDSKSKGLSNEFPKYYQDSLAVIGISCQVPGSKDKLEFWENLCKGDEALRLYSRQELIDLEVELSKIEDPNLVPAQFTIIDKENFDADFFSISPREAEVMDPQLRQLLIHSWRAVEDAGYNVEDITDTGVFMSASNNMYQALSLNGIPKTNIISSSDEYVSNLHGQGGTIPTMISYKLGLKGPSYFIHSNCSSSLVGIHAASLSLRNNDCEYALVGASTLFASSLVGYIHQKGLNFSSDGHLKTFDKDADGMVPSEGVAVILLKRASDAIRDRDHIYGLLRGIAVNNDGSDKAGFYAPSVKGQSRVIQKVLDRTEIDPKSICYVESHGTGTKLGDPIEIAALSEIYGKYTGKEQFCAIGSVKPNIGHLDTAAGVIGCIKVLLSLYNKKIPPMINFSEPNHNINFNNSPFYVNRELKNLDNLTDPLRMAVSSFGLGGTNVHAVFENYILNDKSSSDKKSIGKFYVIPLSALNESDLKNCASSILNIVLDRNNNKPIPNLEQGAYVRDIISLLSVILEIDDNSITKDHCIDELNLDSYQFVRFIKGLNKKWEVDIQDRDIDKSITIDEFVEGFLSDQELEINNKISIEGLAYTLQIGRKPLKSRVVFLSKDIHELTIQLKEFIAGGEKVNVDKCFHNLSSTNNLVSPKTKKYVDNDIRKWIQKGKQRRISKLWVMGFHIDWKLLYPFEKPNRLSLPTYPFSMDRYWLNSRKNKTELSVDNNGEMGILAFKEVWGSKENPIISQNNIGEIVCFFNEKDKEIQSLDWDRLPSQGIIRVLISNENKKIDNKYYSIDSENFIRFKNFFAKIMESHASVTDVIYLSGSETTIDYNAELILIAKIVKVIASCEIKFERFLLASILEGGISDVYKESWIAYERSLQNLNVGFKTSVLLEKNILSTNDFFDHISLELVSDDACVMYNGGKRYIRKVEQVSISQEIELKKIQGTYLITGGAGGLGFLFAEYLSCYENTNIILIGRSSFNSGIQKRISLLENRNRVDYYQCDVCDEPSVLKMLGQVRSKYGDINGLIHAAGMASSDTIITNNLKDFERIMTPKIHGTVILDELLKDEPLDFVCYFSSSSAILGDFGACNYSLANRFQMLYATYRNYLQSKGNRKGKTIAINWPVWNLGMSNKISENTEIYLKATGQFFLKGEEGVELFEKLIELEINDILLIKSEYENAKHLLGDLLKDSFLNQGTQKNEGFKNSENETSLADKIEYDLKEHTFRILKIPIEKIDCNKNLVDFGYDSISMTKLAVELSEHFKIQISPSSFFSYPTLKKFRDFLIETNEPILRQFYEIRSEKHNVHDNKSVLESTTYNENVTTQESIAIIGMSGRFPESRNIHEMWNYLEKGESAIRDISMSRFEGFFEENVYKDENYGKTVSCGCIPGVSEFDPLFFEISPLEAETMDPRQRHLLQESYKALEDAGYGQKQLELNRIGVFVGVEQGDYQKLKHSESLITANHDGILASRISYFLNLTGPVLSINTACSSGLVAVHQACQSLRNKECETAIAAGVNLIFTMNSFNLMKETGMLSPTGKCSAFDQSADGIVLGEAVTALVLKPLTKAIKDGDPIHAVIKGSSINYDGKTNGITAPSGKSQTDLLRNVFENYKINPENINYIVTHGTGTKLGDPIEINALTEAFRKFTNKKNFCALTSPKTNFGHTLAASGIVNIVCLVESLKKNIIPPSLNCNTENSFIAWDESPFYVNKSIKKWQNDNSNLPLMGAVSSFGMSGTNAHLVIESYNHSPIVENNRKENPSNLILVVSAKTSQQLTDKIVQLLDYFEESKESLDKLTEICYTLQNGRHHFKYRCAIIIENGIQVIDLIKTFLLGESSPNILRGEVPRNFIPEKAKDLMLSELQNDFLAKKGEKENFMEMLLFIGKVYCEGYKINWDMLYNGDIPRRVHLPTYPFARESYWISKKKNDSKLINDGISNFFPIEESIGFTKTHYTSLLDKGKLLDYTWRYDSKRYLSGFIYTNFGLESMNFISKKNLETENTVKNLFNVYWGKPLLFNDKDLVLHIALFEDDKIDTCFEIYSGKTDGKSQEFIYCQGNLAWKNISRIPFVNINSFRNSLYKKYRYDGQTFTLVSHNEYVKSGLLMEIGNKSLLISNLTDNSYFKRSKKPAILFWLEKIVELLGVFRFEDENQNYKTDDGYGFYPFFLEDLFIYSESFMPSYVVIQYEIGDNNDDRIEIHIDLCDLKGNVCVRVKSLSVQFFNISARSQKKENII